MSEKNEVLEVETATKETETKETETKEETKKAESLEVQKLKKQLSEYASEISKYKKQYKERLSEEEKAEAERKEQLEAMENELAMLKREKDVSNQKAEYIAIGFESDLAQATAEALVNGDFATVNANLKTHFENVKKQAVADEMKNTPTPAIGSGTQTASLDSILNIKDTEARHNAIASNLDLFDE